MTAINRVWIVEMKSELPMRARRWIPTVACALSKKEASVKLADWRSRNPDDRFRLRQYAAKDTVDYGKRK